MGPTPLSRCRGLRDPRAVSEEEVAIPFQEEQKVQEGLSSRPLITALRQAR